MSVRKQLMEQAVDWMEDMDENDLRIVLVFLKQLRGGGPK